MIKSKSKTDQSLLTSAPTIVNNTARGVRPVAFWLLSAFLAGLIGCGTDKTGKKKEDFFTSGSREADQRASQTMAKNEQLTGSGEGAGEKGVKKAVPAAPGPTGRTAEGTKAAQAEGKQALFDRLGGEQGLNGIIEDVTPRLLQDPRVNWDRKEIQRGGLFHSGASVTWNPTPENVATLKKHLIQFLALATGGPARYDGKPMKSTHGGMHISNPEFDAAIGDFKATLDRLQIPNKEQKELIAIIESTRPEVVTQR